MLAQSIGWGLFSGVIPYHPEVSTMCNLKYRNHVEHLKHLNHVEHLKHLNHVQRLKHLN